ncbi:hypothetical protein Aca07nite_87870 [Actinoplanes capillaceus]|uniref:Aminoglycoside phosphotransferase domain-containing protein n=1 Tax=Actinoplanes campanulatus TaxID=113559 RepID=A0ABQ3WZ77_9ACTN|nr:hypothetical protein Aca07nite_87870 [Actinoplanes capillaceus]
MGDGSPDPDRLLRGAIECLSDDGVDLGGVTFTPVAGGTQATVWKGVDKRDGNPALALRLTPKPLPLIRRIATLVDGVQSVTCPTTVATGQLVADDRTWTVHLCTWIGIGAVRRADMTMLGQHLARLHLDLAATSLDFTDRQLSFDRSPTPSPEQQLPTWYVARHLWRDRIFAWLSTQSGQMAPQPIHGDMHWDNVVATETGFGFIDFDKLMFAPPVFDLAKLIATGMFTGGSKARFQARKTIKLIEGYESVRPLSDVELVALEGLAVLLNEQTAVLGTQYDIDSYRRAADAVASWWITRRRRTRTDPFGIRTARQAAAAGRDTSEQPPLWSEETHPGDR